MEQKGEETIARHRSEGIRWPNSRVTRDVYIETLLNPGRRVRRPHPAPLRSEDSSNPSHPLMPLTNERDRKVGDSDPTTFIPCVHLGVCARFFSLRCKYRKTVRGRERKPSSFSSPLFDICRVLLHQIFFFSFFFAKPLLASKYNSTIQCSLNTLEKGRRDCF